MFIYRTCKSLVSFDSLYGMCPGLSPDSAWMTFPRVERDKLMLLLSVNAWPLFVLMPGKTWEPEMKRSIQQIVDGVGTLYGTAFLSSFASGGQRGEGRGKKKVGRVDTLCFFADGVGNREKFPLMEPQSVPP